MIKLIVYFVFLVPSMAFSDTTYYQWTYTGGAGGTIGDGYASVSSAKAGALYHAQTSCTNAGGSGLIQIADQPSFVNYECTGMGFAYGYLIASYVSTSCPIQGTLIGDGCACILPRFMINGVCRVPYNCNESLSSCTSSCGGNVSSFDCVGGDGSSDICVCGNPDDPDPEDPCPPVISECMVSCGGTAPAINTCISDNGIITVSECKCEDWQPVVDNLNLIKSEVANGFNGIEFNNNYFEGFKTVEGVNNSNLGDKFTLNTTAVNDVKNAVVSGLNATNTKLQALLDAQSGDAVLSGGSADCATLPTCEGNSIACSNSLAQWQSACFNTDIKLKSVNIQSSLVTELSKISYDDDGRIENNSNIEHKLDDFVFDKSGYVNNTFDFTDRVLNIPNVGSVTIDLHPFRQLYYYLGVLVLLSVFIMVLKSFNKRSKK